MTINKDSPCTLWQPATFAVPEDRQVFCIRPPETDYIQMADQPSPKASHKAPGYRSSKTDKPSPNG